MKTVGDILAILFLMYVLVHLDAIVAWLDRIIAS